jgi:hypothetical protein
VIRKHLLLLPAFSLLSFPVFGSLISVGPPGDTLDLSLRFQALGGLPDTLDQTALYRHRYLPWLEGHYALRISEGAINLNAVEYKGEILLHVLEPLTIAMRISQSDYVAIQAGTTVIHFRADAHFGFADVIEGLVSFGWYERMWQLSGTPILPPFSGISDHDILGLLGIGIKATPEWMLHLTLANFEDSINTFNLNNPFAQAAVDYHPIQKNWSLYAAFRYRILLGFGHLDELLIGAGIRFYLDPAAEVAAPLIAY